MVEARAFAFGRPAPDARQGPVGEGHRIGETGFADRTGSADLDRLLRLLGAEAPWLREEDVGREGLAVRPCHPFGLEDVQHGRDQGSQPQSWW